jgi:hypothetical protein
MKGAVDFMPATLSKAVQGERRRASPPRDLRVTIFGTTLRERPRVTQNLWGQSGWEGGEQENTCNLTV